MAKTSIHSKTSLKPIGTLFRKFHFTLFFVFIVACLGAAVLLLNSMLSKNATEDSYTSSISAGTIDSATLDRVKALHTSSEGAQPLVLPEGRTNPFGE